MRFLNFAFFLVFYQNEIYKKNCDEILACK